MCLSLGAAKTRNALLIPLVVRFGALFNLLAQTSAIPLPGESRTGQAACRHGRAAPAALSRYRLRDVMSDEECGKRFIRGKTSTV